MSWSELERMVEEAELDDEIRRALRHCRSRQELVLAGRRLGYRITRLDLVRAWQEHQWEQAQRQPVHAGRPQGPQLDAEV
jgi:hypothetical protein